MNCKLYFCGIDNVFVDFGFDDVLELIVKVVFVFKFNDLIDK